MGEYLSQIMNDASQRVTLVLPGKMVDRLDGLATDADRSRSSTVRRLLEVGLATYEAQVSEAFAADRGNGPSQIGGPLLIDAGVKC